MLPLYERATAALNGAARPLTARARARATDEGVLVPGALSREILAAAMSVHGGASGPTITALLRDARSGQDVVLTGDTAQILARELKSLLRERDRHNKIRRGIIPGAMSAAEVGLLARTRPELFRR